MKRSSLSPASKLEGPQRSSVAMQIHNQDIDDQSPSKFPGQFPPFYVSEEVPFIGFLLKYRMARNDLHGKLFLIID